MPLDDATERLLSHLDEPDLQGYALPFIFERPQDCVRFAHKLIELAGNPERINQKYIRELEESLVHCGNQDPRFLVDLIRAGKNATIVLCMNVIRQLDTFPLELLELVRELITSKDDEISSAACGAAAKGGYESQGIGAEALIPALTGALRRSDRVATAAAYALGQYGPAAAAAIEALKRIYDTTSNELLKYYAKTSVSQIRDED